MPTPEDKAREKIDQQLEAAGWRVQDLPTLNLLAARGVAIREMQSQGGPADYILFVDGKALGVVEAKKGGTTLSAVYEQSARYSYARRWIPQRWADPLPFTYESTGIETYFVDQRDPDARSRPVFGFHTPEHLLELVQHIVSELKVGGTAAVVLPDNVLFEGGAGETIRRELLKRCKVHNLLRLPTGIFYAQGVKANVLFFERKEASETPWTTDLWIYDLRTNQHFTLKTNPLKESDLVDFVKCYKGKNQRRDTSATFKKFSYAEIVARDKANLDIFWLKDNSLEDSANLPPPAELAAEIVECLEAALEEFRSVEGALIGKG